MARAPPRWDDADALGDDDARYDPLRDAEYDVDEALRKSQWRRPAGVVPLALQPDRFPSAADEAAAAAEEGKKDVLEPNYDVGRWRTDAGPAVDYER
eukprot:CAMPEP_0203832848 /NCGR_PEP_ID=MMETSP0115-20131106/71756_1 /ASSEMBLY_ACC=CAM_ASM_000227 /TAXON_ID=33651 /ORGANISM="Bicosoecid sp, Strain ms1" /LENGTH=96 /DNA_ID=CAMNT_0050741917 /DNA_START=3 /DNA_END=290 /DNA_ORIENTATION=+